MLSYQHAYHAGSAADLHKHSALAALLSLLTVKARPISYLESHAGRGLYDLAAPEALKTGEAARGIGRTGVPEGPLGAAIGRVRARHGPEAYPGSPLIAAELLRPQDRIILAELHPAEHKALKAALPAAEIHRRDGHEALRALTPPKPRRGLALIDPSYEVKAEYAQTAETALAVAQRWPEGVVMVWYPLLPEARHEALTGALAAHPALEIHEMRIAEPPERGMTGSGLAFLNLPYGATEALARAYEGCRPVLVPA